MPSLRYIGPGPPSTRFRTQPTIVEHECRGIDPDQSSSSKAGSAIRTFPYQDWPRSRQLGAFPAQPCPVSTPQHLAGGSRIGELGLLGGKTTSPFDLARHCIANAGAGRSNTLPAKANVSLHGNSLTYASVYG